jgi:diguanylate cyclase (GGDEF)-like protein
MPSVLVRIVLAILFLWTGMAWAASTAPARTLVLDERTPSFQIDGDILTWIDEGSRVDIDHVSGPEVQFKPTQAHARHALSKFGTLWIKLRVVRSASSTKPWTLNLPLPFLDSVVLYQPDGSGGWTTQVAGDTLAQADWQKSGLYPDFDLQLSGKVPREFYLQIRNFKAVTVPIRIATEPERARERQLELLTLSLMLGALLTMTALSLLRFAEHRKAIDGWASLFGLLITTTIAQISGVLGEFIWTGVPEIGNYAYSVIPVVAVGCTLLFVRNIFALAVHFRWFDRFLSTVGWGTVVSVLSFAALDRFVADRVTGSFLFFATCVAVVATLLSWRGGTRMGRWMTLALLPQFTAQLFLFAEALGFVTVLWEMRYLTSLAVALTVPALLYALSQLTHDRKELVVRANHLPTQDALTGLLTKEVFQSHLDESVERALESREPIALVVVRVINHSHIRQTLGDTVAEQCLLRAVVKLQRILRDVDPAGRVGTAQFALLMEGVITRDALTERMVKLIASGLIPLPGLVPEVTLHFQAACVLLHDNPVPASRVLDDLRELLASMSPQTRRPIRFLEALPTEASELTGDSSPA